MAHLLLLYRAKLAGPGGFINITQTSKKVIFCGTLTTGAEVGFDGGKVSVIKEGKTRKFVEKVDQVTFSGKYAHKRGCPVLHVTERAVFTLEDGLLTLIEVEPGIDIEKDILGAMEFKPRISSALKQMPAEIFREEWDGLRQIVESDEMEKSSAGNDSAVDSVKSGLRKALSPTWRQGTKASMASA
jgi:propionate CoA-transferase